MPVLTAAWCVPDPDRVLRGGGVLVERGVVRGVASSPAAVRRLARRAGARVQDLDGGVLTPGLVNAHSHLELHDLLGEVSPRGGFGAWIGRLMRARAGRSDARLTRGVRRGADRMLATGTTCVGDIDSLGLTGRALRGHPLRVVRFLEQLDARDPERTRVALGALRRVPGGRPGRWSGLAPHAPFTVSEPLLEAVARAARAGRLPVTIHWAETAAELEWMGRGTGPLAALLPASPRTHGLDLLERHRLLGPRTSLVHGNLPRRGEPARIAASGATLVHCPGSHAFFGREPFPLGRYRRARVRLALGTDSAASNGDVDLRRELALLRAAHPELAPREAWRAATTGAAGALGLASEAGRLSAGRRADLVHFDLTADDPEQILDALTATVPGVRTVRVGGRVVAGG